jgi:hypothetical protein
MLDSGALAAAIPVGRVLSTYIPGSDHERFEILVTRFDVSSLADAFDPIRVLTFGLLPALQAAQESAIGIVFEIPASRRSQRLRGRGRTAA